MIAPSPDSANDPVTISLPARIREEKVEYTAHSDLKSQGSHPPHLDPVRVLLCLREVVLHLNKPGLLFAWTANPMLL
jgi:hypothetical protein